MSKKNAPEKNVDLHVAIQEDSKPQPILASPEPRLSKESLELLDDLRAHIRICPAAMDELGNVIDLEWDEIDGGIETSRGGQNIRLCLYRDENGKLCEEVVLTHIKFRSKKVIPLR